MVDNLTVYHLWFIIEATTPISLQEWSGSAIRGALIGALRKHYCVTAPTDPSGNRAGGDDRHQAICPVCWLIADEDREAERGRNIPRPYTIEPPKYSNRTVEPGSMFSFGVSLVGRAAHLFPYLILALPEMGRIGVGRFERQQGGRGRFILRSATAINPLSGSTQQLFLEQAQVQSPSISVTQDQVMGKTRKLVEITRTDGNQIQIHFHTPTRIVAGSRLVHRPEFAPLCQRLLERLGGLSRYYSVGEAVGMTDRETLLALADRVTLVDDQTRWVELASGSRRLGRTTPISGYQGRAIYHADDWAPLLPWLLWGQSLHVGKSAVKGNGWFTLAGCPGWPDQLPPTDRI